MSFECERRRDCGFCGFLRCVFCGCDRRECRCQDRHDRHDCRCQDHHDHCDRKDDKHDHKDCCRHLDCRW